MNVQMCEGRPLVGRRAGLCALSFLCKLDMHSMMRLITRITALRCHCQTCQAGVPICLNCSLHLQPTCPLQHVWQPGAFHID